MYLWNLEKGLHHFDEMYVSSDDNEILEVAEKMGAIAIKRSDPHLMECPNIEWYQHAYQFMEDPDIVVAIQANSPSIHTEVISDVVRLMKKGSEEVKTCHEGGKDYGSVWALTKERLFNYPDPYHAKPDKWVTDVSVDIHTIDDVREALQQL